MLKAKEFDIVASSSEEEQCQVGTETRKTNEQEQDAVGGEEREGQRVQNAYADIMRCEMVCQVVRRIFQISAMLAIAVGLGG